MALNRRDPFLNDAIAVLDQAFYDHRQSVNETLAALSSIELKFINDETTRCGLDERYYLENYHIIQDAKKVGFRSLYPFWDSQEIFFQHYYDIKSLGKPVRLLILKARQLGISTVSEGLLFHATIFTEGWNSLVVAQDPGQADYLFSMCRRAYDALPWWMRPERRYEAKGKYLTLDRNDQGERLISPGLRSEIFVEAANKLSGVAVGKGINGLHASEMSLWATPVVLTEQILPTLEGRDDVLAFLESTARGRDNFFYKFWKQAVSGELEWTTIFIESFRVKRYSLPIVEPEKFSLTEDETKLHQKVLVEKNFDVPKEHFNWRRAKMKEFEAMDDEWGFFQEYPAFCITAGTMVSTEMGMIPVEQAAEAKWTESGAVEHWIRQAPSPVFTVETEHGRSLEATADHPIMLSTGEWKAVGKIVPGDVVKLRPPMFCNSAYVARWNLVQGVPVSIEVDRDWALLLGYFLGDGCVYKSELSITCDSKDVDVHEEVKSLIGRLMGPVRTDDLRKRQHATRTNAIAFTCRVPDDHRGSAIVTVLRKLGAIKDGKKWPTRKVSVPECIFRSPKCIVAAFLSALFECDGSMQHRTVRFYTKYLEFARQVQLLLLGFGINGKFNPVEKKGGSGKVYRGYDFWLPGHCTDLFMSEVGFRSARKKSEFHKPHTAAGRPRNPIVLEDKVVSVKPTGIKESFDFTITGEHAFSANGILTHNSWVEAFQTSGLCAFNKKRLQKLLETTCCEPLWYGEIDLDQDNKARGIVNIPDVRLHSLRKEGLSAPPAAEMYGSRFYVWEMPEPGESYYLGCDVARGVKGGDFSCVQVLRIGRGAQPDVQVAEWHGWISPEPYASVCAAIGYWYNTAQIAVESNDIGILTNNTLFRSLEYPNVFRWKQYDKIKNFMTDWFGWLTNVKTRDQIISKMAYAIDQSTIVLRSAYLVDEMFDFAQEDKRSRVEALTGNDDRILAAMICYWCAHDSEFGIQAANQESLDHGRATGPERHGMISKLRTELGMLAIELQKMSPDDPQRNSKLRKLNEASAALEELMKDFANSDFSPIHDSPLSNRGRLYREGGVPEEFILYTDPGMGAQVSEEDRWKLG